MKLRLFLKDELSKIWDEEEMGAIEDAWASLKIHAINGHLDSYGFAMLDSYELSLRNWDEHKRFMEALENGPPKPTT